MSTKRIGRFIFWALALLFFSFPTIAQNDEEKNWTVSGYVKNLQSVLSISAIEQLLVDNLVHNRINFRWYPHKNWEVGLENRNRLFFGNQFNFNPSFADQIEAVNNGYFDFSVHLINDENWLLNSTLDRGYVQYSQGKFETRIGRQRINWGINTIWNPNDIFNAFSFTDFDYEERPGSDAILVRYYTGIISSIEVAANFARRRADRVVAALYKFNAAKYDWQILLGLAGDFKVVGQGWAGNIGSAGFKGEWSYFFGHRSTGDGLAVSAAIDYVFGSGVYINGGYLYNSNGTTRGTLATLFDFELSALNLYPFRHAILLQQTVPISPLVTGGLVWIYSPVKAHPLFLNPSFTLSLSQEWDLDVVAQLSWNKENASYVSPFSAGFLRIKYSF